MDNDTLIGSLAIAVNVEVDDTGRITRRKGYAPTKVTLGVHSLFCNGGHCLFMYNGSLYRLLDSFMTDVSPSYTGIRSGLNNNVQMYYVQVADRIYYSNGYDKGIYDQTTEKSTAWVAGAYVGPTTTKTFSDPPLGIHLEYFNGRIYMADDNVVWYSEPFALNWFDLARNFIPFPNKVRMIRAVIDGIWISTDTQIFFLAGPDPTSSQLVKCADYPAIEGTDVTVEGLWIGNGIKTKAALWTSIGGICAGLPGGEFQNLTQRKITLPLGLKGAAGLIDNKYISLIEP